MWIWDYMCRENFYDSLQGPVALSESPCDDELYQNSLMAAEPGEEVFIKLMNLVCNQVGTTTIHPDNKDDYVLGTTGPRIFSMLNECHYDRTQGLPSRIYNPPLCDLGQDHYKCIHLLSGHWGKEQIDLAVKECSRSRRDYKDYMKECYENWREVPLDTIS